MAETCKIIPISGAERRKTGPDHVWPMHSNRTVAIYPYVHTNKADVGEKIDPSDLINNATMSIVFAYGIVRGIAQYMPGKTISSADALRTMAYDLGCLKPNERVEAFVKANQELSNELPTDQSPATATTNHETLIL